MKLKKTYLSTTVVGKKLVESPKLNLLFKHIYAIKIALENLRT